MPVCRGTPGRSPNGCPGRRIFSIMTEYGDSDIHHIAGDLPPDSETGRLFRNAEVLQAVFEGIGEDPSADLTAILKRTGCRDFDLIRAINSGLAAERTYVQEAKQCLQEFAEYLHYDLDDTVFRLMYTMVHPEGRSRAFPEGEFSVDVSDPYMIVIRSNARNFARLNPPKRFSVSTGVNIPGVPKDMMMNSVIFGFGISGLSEFEDGNMKDHFGDRLEKINRLPVIVINTDANQADDEEEEDDTFSHEQLHIRRKIFRRWIEPELLSRPAPQNETESYMRRAYESALDELFVGYAMGHETGMEDQLKSLLIQGSGSDFLLKFADAGRIGKDEYQKMWQEYSKILKLQAESILDWLEDHPLNEPAKQSFPWVLAQVPLTEWDARICNGY